MESSGMKRPLQLTRPGASSKAARVPAQANTGGSVLRGVHMFIDHSAETGSSKIAAAAGASIHKTQRALPTRRLVPGAPMIKVTEPLRKKEVAVVGNDWLRRAIITGDSRTYGYFPPPKAPSGSSVPLRSLAIKLAVCVLALSSLTET